MTPLHLLADFYAYRLHTLHAFQAFFFFLDRSIKKLLVKQGQKKLKFLVIAFQLAQQEAHQALLPAFLY